MSDYREYPKFCVEQTAPPQLELKVMEAALAENPANRFFGSFRQPVGVAAAAVAPAMAILTGKKWANGRTLKVRFLEGDPALQNRVATEARKWAEQANINFDFGNHADAEIRTAFQLGEGSWSAIGTDALVREWFPADEPTMNFGWLTPGSSEATIREVVLHEFGHAIGCIHEHQHPEAGIPWNRAAVSAALSGPPNNWTPQQIQFNVFDRHTASQTQFSRFDPLSIMGYYVPRQWTTNGFEMIPGSVLSATDIDFIAKVYPRGAAIVPLTVGGAPVNASIGLIGEEDYYSFSVAAPGVYIVETFGTTDVVASLFGPSNPNNLIAEDDDSGVGRNAQIVASLALGNYRIMIRHYDQRGTGNYQIRVRRS